MIGLPVKITGQFEIGFLAWLTLGSFCNCGYDLKIPVDN